MPPLCWALFGGSSELPMWLTDGFMVTFLEGEGDSLRTRYSHVEVTFMYGSYSRVEGTFTCGSYSHIWDQPSK